MIYLKLFWSFFQVGILSIGGGYAAIPLIQQQVVQLNSWLTMSEFADIITIAEMTPGPIAINSATFVGIHISGVLGAVVATVGCVLPSAIIVSVLAILYNKYKKLDAVKTVLAALRPAVIGMIAFAGFSIMCLALWGGAKINLKLTNYYSLGIFAAAFIAVTKFKKISPIYIMLAAGALGVVFFYFL